MKLLVKKDNFEVYVKVDTDNLWIDPVLILKSGRKQEDMTVSSGELELPLGEFVVNENFVSDMEKVEAVLAEIANEDTIVALSPKRTKFTLKPEYLEIMKEAYYSK